MAWPTPLEYQEAVQNPSFCFRDGKLLASHPVVDILGLPKVASGNFACVFQLRSNTETFAVRCFSREVTDQRRRYDLLSRYLGTLWLPWLVAFEYLMEGIQVRGRWYPIVKMEWVEGQTLEAYVDHHLNNPNALRRAAARWRGLVAGLRGARIAHGDLQHGNVLVDDNAVMRLVDYDAMFIPPVSGERSPELGHPNYQHCQRRAEHYDQSIDNFAALVIYTSLQAIAADPALWIDYHTGDNLILAQGDYSEPQRSPCLERMKNSHDSAVSQLAVQLERSCQDSLANIPDLEAVLGDVEIAPVSGHGPVARQSLSMAPSTASAHVAIASGASSTPSAQSIPAAAPPRPRKRLPVWQRWGVVLGVPTTLALIAWGVLAVVNLAGPTPRSADPGSLQPTATSTATPTPVPRPTATFTPTARSISASTSTPTPILHTTDDRVLASLENWLQENRYSLWSYGQQGWPLDLDIDDIAAVGKHVWAVGYLHGIGGQGRILHSPDSGNTWEVQWQSGTYGPDPFEVEFASVNEGWVAADDAVLHTSDGGETWTSIWTRTAFGAFMREFSVTDPQHLCGRLSNGLSICTDDGGKIWR